MEVGSIVSSYRRRGMVRGDTNQGSENEWVRHGTDSINVQQTIRKKEVIFLYDYLIDCGGFRFSLSFNLDERNPLFHYFLIQPILPIN